MDSTSNDVALAYDSVTRCQDGDMSSSKTPFRAFNNYVKKNLIQIALDTVRKGNSTLQNAAVLDLASGRGGDIGKWFFSKSATLPELRVSHYHCFDISPESVKEAERRYLSFSGSEVQATFEVADCFSDTFLEERLPLLPHCRQYSVVSIQFALHYACDTEAHIEKVIKAISESLQDGGVFIATTVDEDSLSSYVRQNKKNSLFTIQLNEPVEWVCPFGSKNPRLKIGMKYHFQLEGLVDSPEYVVPIMMVRKYASIYGLVELPEASKSFDAFFADYTTSWNNTRRLELSEDEKALIHLYCSLCFVKGAKNKKNDYDPSNLHLIEQHGSSKFFMEEKKGGHHTPLPQGSRFQKEKKKKDKIDENLFSRENWGITRD